MYLFSHWPTYPCAIFFEPPPPPPFRFSFLSSILYHSSSLSLPRMEHKTYAVPSRHLTPLIFYLSAIIWYLMGGQGKREEAGGEERKEVAGVGRGMKNVKILKGWKKGKFCACRSEKGGGRQGAGGARPTPPPPPVHPLIFEKPAVTTLKNV